MVLFFFILFIAWERWEELVSRLGNLSWELGGLGSSFPDHALGPNWDSGIGTHHMLTAPFGRPIGEQNHCLERFLTKTCSKLISGNRSYGPGVGPPRREGGARTYPSTDNSASRADCASIGLPRHLMQESQTKFVHPSSFALCPLTKRRGNVA